MEHAANELTEKTALKVPVEGIVSQGINRRNRLKALQDFAEIILNPSQAKKLATMYMNAAARSPTVRMHWINSMFRLFELEARQQTEKSQPVIVNVYTNIRDTKELETVTLKSGGHSSESTA